MGWHMAGLLVRGRTLDEVVSELPGSPRSTGARLAGDEALRMSLDADYAVAEVHGWIVVSDPRVRVAWGDAGVALSGGGGRALSFLVEYSATTYGFSWQVDGRVVRTALYCEGESAQQVGDELTEEVGLPDPGREDMVVELLQRLTGIRFAELVDARYVELRCDESLTD